MVSHSEGSVVLIKFPFSDLSSSKLRPAVVHALLVRAMDISFTNRYRSIICEDDLYLLELTRYIHLNTLRRGIVEGVKNLNTYPWSGHAARKTWTRSPG